ncbi:Hypothetical_protein [Hexamita inflata]|uniref:Hypothetical_protein n=1 Tax=Hexamita inflata TaxID=28002 RepID=A0AA86UCL1_9EUKA|nr:Hypothetical protein HINF_LOCUS24468 [Hexamita inflata]
MYALAHLWTPQIQRVNNCSVSNSNISGQISVSGIVGFQTQNVITIMNSLTFQTNISGAYYIGGIIGQCQSKLYLTNTQIQLVRVVSATYIGIVVGNNFGGTYSFINSTAVSNFANGVQQEECTVLKTNSWSITGC